MIVPWPWNNRGEAGGRNRVVLSAANRWKSEPQCPTPAVEGRVADRDHSEVMIAAHPPRGQAGGRTQRDRRIHHQGRHSESNHRWSLHGFVRGDPVTGTWPEPRPPRYEIRVRGRLGEMMLSAFPALRADSCGEDTLLTGPLVDSAALYGVLAELEALGLELVEVRRTPPDLRLLTASTRSPAWISPGRRHGTIVGMRASRPSDTASGGDVGGVVSRPALLKRLGTSARVTVVSAPAGSGKTVLLRSWIAEGGLVRRVAWVPVGRDERGDPQRFWLLVIQALRRTDLGSGLVQAVSAAPDLDGWAVVEHLLGDLAALEDQVWLVVDDVHELGSSEVLRQIELLVMRAPPQLRFVLATRHDVRLGLHRLRLEGELGEIGAADLRFSLAEAGELLAAAGVELPEPALVMLHKKTEGWAAGLRLAALSFAGHPDPGRFRGRVLRQRADGGRVSTSRGAGAPERAGTAAATAHQHAGARQRGARRLVDRGRGRRARVLQDLEDADAFVVSLDPARKWFRYHRMFADLLQLQLRRTAPSELAALHRSAAGWFDAHEFPVEAIRHAQAAQDWGLAARLLADCWPGLHLDGQAATVHELLAGFPAGLAAADAGLAVVAAADELAQGSLEAAERYLEVAERGSASVPEARRGQLELLLGVVRLLLHRQREPAGCSRGCQSAVGHGRHCGRGAPRPRGGPTCPCADQPW